MSASSAKKRPKRGCRLCGGLRSCLRGRTTLAIFLAILLFSTLCHIRTLSHVRIELVLEADSMLPHWNTPEKAADGRDSGRTAEASRGVRVLSYSLYGPPNPRYTDGIVANARLALSVYPGWEFRVYHHPEASPDALAKLSRYENVALVNVSTLPRWVLDRAFPMTWRFLVASDPTVEAYACRDADGRLNVRERAAVDEWLRSGRAFHLMHDHNRHGWWNNPMMGGLWGGLRRAVPQMEDLLLDFFNSSGVKRYGEDQNFLRLKVWPMARKDMLHHDSYFCRESGGIAFPMTREQAGRPYDFVGDVFNGEEAGLLERDAMTKSYLDPGKPDAYKKYVDCLHRRWKQLDALRSGNGTSFEGYVSNAMDGQADIVEDARDGRSRPKVCFPHASGPVPERRGLVRTDTTSLGRALHGLATQTNVHRIVEIGTGYGGGSTEAFADGLSRKVSCDTNSTHHCCTDFVVTFEVYEPAWAHARLYHQDNPVWLVKGTTVGLEGMLSPDEILSKGAHYDQYYERDKEIMRTRRPLLERYCSSLRPVDVVLIDGNEYTGWEEFKITMRACRPTYLALNSINTIKTQKVEAHMRDNPSWFELLDRGEDSGSWAVYRVHKPWNEDDYRSVPRYTFWSSDFHISPIADFKDMLRSWAETREHIVIDESLSGHCSVKNPPTCYRDLKVFTRGNALDFLPCPNGLKRQFWEQYANDPRMNNVDAFLCHYVFGMCEAYMPLGRPMIAIASSIRYELGRESPDAWRRLNDNVRAIASRPRNTVAANNRFDAEYIKHFTGLTDVRVLPNYCGHPGVVYKPSHSEILIGPEQYSQGGDGLIENPGGLLEAAAANSSYKFVKIRRLYPHHEYADLASHPAIVLVPDQISLESMFEYYRMGIPMFVPTPDLLATWQHDHRVMKNCVGARDCQDSPSKIGAHPNSPHPATMDPNDQKSLESLKYWMRFADFYQWPHFILFKDWDDLFVKLNESNLTDVHVRMMEYNMRQRDVLKRDWMEILDRAFHGMQPRRHTLIELGSNNSQQQQQNKTWEDAVLQYYPNVSSQVHSEC